MNSTSRKAAVQIRLDVALAWTYLNQSDHADWIAALLFTNVQALKQRLALGSKPGAIAAHHILAAHAATKALSETEAQPERNSHH